MIYCQSSFEFERNPEHEWFFKIQEEFLGLPGNSKNSYDKKTPQVYVRYHKT